MKDTASALPPNRCQHRTPSGRQCCSSATQPGAPFCARHTVAMAALSDSTDFSADLVKVDDHFQEAQQINLSLISLYKLVAAGRISPRRASVLAYIAHLILNSLKAIDYDHRWYKKRLTGLPITPGVPEPMSQPSSFHAGPVGPRTKPLPDTPEAFLAEVAKRTQN